MPPVQHSPAERREKSTSLLQQPHGTTDPTGCSPLLAGPHSCPQTPNGSRQSPLAPGAVLGAGASLVAHGRAGGGDQHPAGITRSQRSPGPGLRCQLHPAPRGPPTHSSSSSSTQPGSGGKAALAAASGKGEEGLSPPCHPPPRLSERKVPRTPAAGAGKVSACHRHNQRDGNHPRQARVTSHPWERCRRGVGAVTASHGANRADEGHLQKSTGLAALSTRKRRRGEESPAKARPPISVPRLGSGRLSRPG